MSPSSGASESPRLAPPDATSPAAGACAHGTGSTVSIALNPDGPAPRCVTVSAEQQLRVVNQSGVSAITVSWAGYPSRSVPAGKATVYDRPFGDYLAPGVHEVRISQYESGPLEVWLR